MPRAQNKKDTREQSNPEQLYVLRVSPIAKGSHLEVLSYFSKKRIPRNGVVYVPMRKQTIPALVLQTQSVRDIKTTLKSAGFPLRKVSRSLESFQLSNEIVEASRATAAHFATHIGAVLYAVIPKSALAFQKLYFTRKKSKKRKNAPRLFVQHRQERMSRYKTMIREAFAKRESFVVVVPNIADALSMEAELSRGVQEYTLCFHSGISKKEAERCFEKAYSEEHPLLIIGTPQCLSLPRGDIGMIVLEHESSRAYRMLYRPSINTSVWVEHYAHAYGSELVLADSTPRVETLWREERKELAQTAVPYSNSPHHAKTLFVDMRAEHKKKAAFEVLSTEMSAMIGESVQRGEHCLLFALRRGIAGTVVCQDCGSTVMSKDGTTPMVLKKTPRGNAFVSNTTGEMRDAHERCLICTSWRLEALGIGVERVYDVLKNIVPKEYIFEVSKDSTPTHKKVQKVVHDFYKTTGSILIGTPLVLPYLTKSIENSGVVSLDSLLSMPAWRASEYLFSLVHTLKNCTTKRFILQTRRAENEVARMALEGKSNEFYKQEIALRKDFKYPPFSILVKVSVSGSSTQVEKDMQHVETIFKPFDLHIYPVALRGAFRGEKRCALIRVPREKWPLDDILERIKGLPPHIYVEVDPEDLF